MPKFQEGARVTARGYDTVGTVEFEALRKRLVRFDSGSKFWCSTKDLTEVKPAPRTTEIRAMLKSGPTYERSHGGRTPAEDGERAARFELSANADSFAKASGSYKIVKAALALIKAQDALEAENFELTDWESYGKLVARIELKDLVDGNKFWVTL